MVSFTSRPSITALNGTLLYLSETGRLKLGGSWLVILGTLGTLALARALAPILDGDQPTPGTHEQVA